MGLAALVAHPLPYVHREKRRIARTQGALPAHKETNISGVVVLEAFQSLFLFGQGH